MSATVGESEFDADTRLAGDGPAFETVLPEDWGGGPGVNGGFMLALCTRALARVLPFPDPSSSRASTCGPARPARPG